MQHSLPKEIKTLCRKLTESHQLCLDPACFLMLSRMDVNRTIMAGCNARNKKLRNATGTVENYSWHTGQLKDVVGNYTGKVCQGKTMKGFECQAKKTESLELTF